MSFGINVAHSALLTSNPDLGEVRGLKLYEAVKVIKERCASDEYFFEKLIPYIHEFAHFSDLYSTPFGNMLCLLDHVINFSRLRICHLVRDRWPAKKELRFPLADYVHDSCFDDQVLVGYCEDHIRLRTSINTIKNIYYNGTLGEISGQNVDRTLFDSIDNIPIFNRSFFYPKNKTFPRTDGDIGGLAVVDILEAMALLSECFVLNRFTAGGDSQFLDRLLNIFPRRPTAVKLYNFITQEYGHTSADLPRYVMWKSLQGALRFPNYFDHLESVDFSTQHPVLRLNRLLAALSENSQRIPSHGPKYNDDWYSFDEQLSKQAGLDSLAEMRSRIPPLSAQIQFTIYSHNEEAVIKLSRPYIAKADEYFIKTHHDFPKGLSEVMNGVHLFSTRETEPELDDWRRPLLAIVGDHYIFDQRFQHERSLHRTFAETVISFAYSDSDSLAPSLLWRQWLESHLGKSLRAQDGNLEEGFLWEGLLGRKYGDIGSTGRARPAAIPPGVPISLPYRTGRPSIYR